MRTSEILKLLARPWTHYADFIGRSRRTEYWLFLAMRWGIVIVLGMLISDGGDHPPPGYETQDGILFIVIAIWFFGTAIPAWAIGARRLHDNNQSGMWLLTCLIPYIGLLASLVIGLLPGTPGENDKGFDPRLPDDAAGMTELERTFS